MEDGSIFFNDTSSTTTSDGSYPFDVPACPEEGVLYVFYHLPDLFIQQFLTTKIETTVITIVFPIIVVFGLLSNACFLFTIYRVREMRTIVNFYLANLAISDMLLVTSTAIGYLYPYLSVSHAIRGGTPQTHIGCILFVISTFITYFASICLVTLVSFERFLAICYPLKHRAVNSKSRTVQLTLCAWFVAALLTAAVTPLGAKLNVTCVVWPPKYQRILPSVFAYCFPVSPVFLDIGTSFTLIPFVVALILNTIFYIMIIRRLDDRKSISEENPTTGQDHATRQGVRMRNSVARMLVVNGLIFFVCLSVYQFHSIDQYLYLKSRGEIDIIRPENEGMVQWIGNIMTVLNSAVNPVIYSATNSRYRKAFKIAVFGSVTNIQSARNLSYVSSARRVEDH